MVWGLSTVFKKRNTQPYRKGSTCCPLVKRKCNSSKSSDIWFMAHLWNVLLPQSHNNECNPGRQKQQVINLRVKLETCSIQINGWISWLFTCRHTQTPSKTVWNRDHRPLVNSLQMCCILFELIKSRQFLFRTLCTRCIFLLLLFSEHCSSC